MADELKHDLTALGTTLQRTDWEDVNIHVFDSQATGDLAYASSATQISRFAIGAGDTILSSQGGIPVWRTPANILTDLSGQAGAAFGWGGQNLTNLGSLSAHTLAGTVTIGGQVFDAAAGYVEIDTTGKVGLLMDGGIFTGGSAVHGYIQNEFGGNFLSDGSGTWAEKNRFEGSLTTVAGDTAFIEATLFGNTIITQNAGETIAWVAQVRINEPNITIGTDTITVAASLYVNGAPTEGVTNAAIYVAGGDVKFAGSLDSAAIADQVALGGYEIGAGNRVLAISQETAVAVEVDETKFSHKMQCQINGATYFIMLTQT